MTRLQLLTASCLLALGAAWLAHSDPDPPLDCHIVTRTFTVARGLDSAPVPVRRRVTACGVER